MHLGRLIYLLVFTYIRNRKPYCGIIKLQQQVHRPPVSINTPGIWSGSIQLPDENANVERPC